MAHTFDSKNLLGGLNSDDEVRNIPQGDYLFAKNIRNAITAANKGGTLTNILGNLKITKVTSPYNGGTGLPAGRNKCIGAVEDTNYGGCIFMVWNSQGKHGIYRYYRNQVDPANPYGAVEQIIQYDFGWTRSLRITSMNLVYGDPTNPENIGDLLYWCDPKPRKINITKGNVVGKLKSWNLYLPNTIGFFPSSVLINSLSFSGTVLHTTAITMPPPPDPPVPIPVTINALVGFQAPDQVFLGTIIPEMAVGFTFTITGAADPANDQQYTVVSFSTTTTGTQVYVAETVVFGVPATATIDYEYLPPPAEDTRTRDLFIQAIADGINADANSIVIAEACDCKLFVTEKVAGTVWEMTTDTVQIIVSARNWYGATLIERFFDRCKWQPLNEPIGLYGRDLDVINADLPNYVQNKVFQFRLGYNYDDREPSALGVWSKIPVNNIQCDGTPNPLFTFIDVDFNDTLIPTGATLVLLKQVRFIARQLNTGKDRLVITLEPCDFLDYDGTNWYCHFKFYNNIISDVVDDATAAKLFDDVPIESAAEIMKDNRMIEGNCLTGYNAPDCTDASFNINIQESKNKKTHKVRGKIRILTYGLNKERASSGAVGGFENFYPTDQKYPFWKPSYVPNMQPPPNVFGGAYSGAPLLRGGIFHDVANQAHPFFGGGSFSGTGNDTFGITTGMETDFDQRIPEGGFVVYSAGLPNYTISRQVNINCATDQFGALDTSSQLKVDRIGQYLFNQNDVPFDLYSEFELDLPDGVHVIRLASHWCSKDDVLEKGFVYDLKNGLLYQKTSTNVHAVIDNGGNWLLQKELTITVNGADVDAGEFIVMDIAPPIGYDSNSWQSISGYLYDDNGKTNPNAADFAGIPVEKTIVFFGGYTWQSDGTPIFGAGTEIGVDYRTACATDANGYFFQIAGTHINPQSPPIVEAGSNNMQVFATNSIGKLRSVDTTLGVGTLSNLLNKDLQIIDFNGSNVNYGTGTIFCIATTNNVNSRTAARTITGTVIDQNGIGVNGVLAIYQEGRNTITNANGVYTFIAWYDAVEANKGYFPNGLTAYNLGYGRSVDDLIFNASAFCNVTYPNGQFLSFSATGTMPLPDFIIVENNTTLYLKTRKRGGKYIDGIRYYDNAGRLCSVVKLWEIYIPFETEDLSQYNYVLDSGGSPYTTPTYIGGAPVINWALNYSPPEWAAYYQFVRTKNLIYGRYLQWVANDVTYLSRTATASTPEVITSFGNGDAVAIKISISNIVDYLAVNSDSLIGYQYQDGDRMRLLYDRDIELIEGFNDFEITGFDSTTQSLIVKTGTYPNEIFSGFTIEIFNPKSVETEDQQIFYEVGEVYKCTAPNTPTNQHGTTSGTFDNGDTFWVGRNILVNDTDFAKSVNVFVESPSISDFYISEAQDIGRIGVIDNNFRQVRRPMLLKASNQFIPATAINGLSAFEALNETELDRANGSIQRLVSINQTVVAISNVRETSTYIQVVTFQQANQGNGVIAIANQYFGTQYPHSKTLGTDLPASVFINDGIIFGYHSGRSDVFMYQGDGETPISDIKMKNYFQELANSGVSDAVAVYDRFHEEYWLTIWRNKEIRTTINTIATPARDIKYVGIIYAEGADLPVIGETITFQYLLNGVWATVSGVCDAISPYSEGGNVVYFQLETEADLQTGTTVNIIYSKPETICWFNGNDSIQKRRWVSQFDFTPEQYCQIASEVVMFKDGELWISDKNPIRNNFFGVQYKTEITPVFNAQPQLLKVWNANILKTFQANGQNDWSAPIITNDNGQQSRLVKGSWVKKGEDWFAAFKRDLNDITVTNPIVNGRALRSSTLVCQLQNDTTGELTLYGWFANFTLSERTQPK